MKALFIGGTGNISSAVTQQAIAAGWDLTLLTRGLNTSDLSGFQTITADINDESAVLSHIDNEQYDCVVDWIAFDPADVKRDIRLFAERCAQYIFISSASAYQKPPTHPIITEATPLVNPFWDYARNKIASEDVLINELRTDQFPAVIVRPSLTYNTLLPIAIGGWGCYTLPQRMLDGQEIIVHGDGTSLWTVTHADDFARGFVPLMGNPLTIGQSFHITSDELLSWNQIYDTIGNALGVTPNVVHIPSDFIASVNPVLGAGLLGDKAHSAIFDNSRIRQFVPDFKATIPFYQGVQRALAWYDAAPGRKRTDASVNADMDAIIAAYRAQHP